MTKHQIQSGTWKHYMHSSEAAAYRQLFGAYRQLILHNWPYTLSNLKANLHKSINQYLLQ